MSRAMPSSDVERFRLVIAQRIGLQFEDDRLAWLARVLAQRAEASPYADVNGYLDGLGKDDSASEFRAMAAELTVPETYFFRNIEQFNALREVALPDRRQANAGTRTLRLLSAGCASGEEAYSMAMLLASEPAQPGWDIGIQAFDLNPAVVAKAQAARYSDWSLRETPDGMRQRWFTRDGSDHKLDEQIKQAVRFSQRNLIDADESFWLPDVYDVVFCRNVLMYFRPDQIRAVVARLTRSLAPGGYLFLGHAESLRGLSGDFHLLHTHGTFYYQRKRQSDVAHALPIAQADAAKHDGDWVKIIGQAANRVRDLTTTHQEAAGQTALDTNASADMEGLFEQAMRLFGQERFNEALAAIAAMPNGITSTPMRLLHAVLLVHAGQLARAEVLCRQSLAEDEFDANAHHVLALCREGAGDPQGAMDSDQTAAYLDPVFAMPHLHLGLLARRLGDRDTVRRELKLALHLLNREEPDRLQLFGGGFSRQALLSLCQAELAACGET